MVKFLVMARPKHGDPDAPIRELKSEPQALELAQTIFKDNTMFRVSIIKFDSSVMFGSKYDVVFKRQSNCKHTSMQTEFPFARGKWIMRCMKCGLEMKHPPTVGELEKRYGDD